LETSWYVKEVIKHGLSTTQLTKYEVLGRTNRLLSFDMTRAA
jgi:hypothetical protein